MMLLSDGTVMLQDGGTDGSGNGWYRLTPDAFGNYFTGSWSPLQPMNTGRLDYASAVLPSGKVFVAGGEHTSAGAFTFSNLGEIFDPTVTNSAGFAVGNWTPIAPLISPSTNLPVGIGDAMSEVLPDQRVLVGPAHGGGTQYIYNPANNTWSVGPTLLNGDMNDEEGWVKLPDGTILTYELGGTQFGGGQRLILGASDAQDQWVSAFGGTPVFLGSIGANPDGSGGLDGPELGPGLLLSDGRVFWVGANSNTALYTPPTTLMGTGSWQTGPTIPYSFGGFDAPAAVLPNGKVLFAASPPLASFPPPTSIFEFDPIKFASDPTHSITDVTPLGPTTPFLNTTAANSKQMLMLPNGDVLFNDESIRLWVYRPDGAPSAAWKPTITSITNNGGIFTLTGTQLNGLSEGATYGDDSQMASNFPIVRLTSSFGTVSYARTFNWSSAGVATGSTPESTQFTLPASVTPGVYQLQVIANGIASNPVLFLQMGAANSFSLRVKPGDSSTLQVLQAGSLLAEYPFSSIPAGIVVNGGAGLDALTLDLSNGNPIPEAGISYDGGGGDEILVTGSNALTCSLTDTSLTVTSGGTLFGKVSLSHVGEAVLDGGPSGNNFTISGWTGVGQVNGQGLSNTLSVTAPAGATVNVTGSAATFGTTSISYSDIQSLAVSGGGGDAFILSPGVHDLDELPATVTINGGASSTAILDDQSNTPEFSSSWSVSGTNVTRSYSTLFFIGSTPIFITTTRSINYSGISALTLNGGPSSGFTLSPSVHNLDELPALVTLTGGASSTAVLNDQSNTPEFSSSWAVGGVSVTRSHSTLFIINSHPVLFTTTRTIDYSGLSALTLNGGASSGFSLSPNLHFLGELTAAVTINGGASSTAVLNDQGNLIASAYNLSASSLVETTNLTLPTISYSGLAGLTLNAGSGANQIWVTSTAASTPVTVNTGTGNSTVTLGGVFFATLNGIRSAVTVNGQGVANQVTLNNDWNTTTPDQVTATGSTVTSNTSGSFFGPGGSLTYNNIGLVSLFTSDSSTGSSITVFPGGGVLFKILGFGQPAFPGNSLTVEPLSGNVLTQHSTGTGAGNYTFPGSPTILVIYSNMQSVSPVGLLAVGSGPGPAPDVHVYDPQGGALKYDLHPFTNDSLGGVRVAVGDVNADGIPDIITAQGPGGGTVQVFDGATGKPLAGPLASFTPFGPDYHHGLWVSAADVNGDGHADIVVGEDAGGEPRVRVFSGKDGSLRADFLAFDPSFRGGVRVAVADFNHDHHADIVAGQGPGGQAVNVFEGATLSLSNAAPAPAFAIPQPFAVSFDQGVYVATGDVYGDGVPKILVSQGAGHDPEVAVFDGAAGRKELASFVVRGFQDGARVAAADINGDGRADIIVAAVQGDAVVRGYDGLSLQEDGHFTAFGPDYRGGLFVGGFGHWGDFATAVGRTLSGPQGDLQTALADLTTIQASLADRGDRRRLAEALDLLYSAFNAPAWVDSSHLQGGTAADVFADEEAALQGIADLIQHSRGAVPGQKLQADLSQVVLSDEELAQVAIADAKDGDAQKVRKAQAALREGQNDFAAAFAGGAFTPEQLDAALDDFREAWEEASKA
jgi:hypothetical protein